MNYLEIVIEGYFNKNNRENLEKYFYRECKKAEKNDFEATEFFSGCFNVIEDWERNLQEQIFERKTQLILILNSAKNDKLLSCETNDNDFEEQRKKTIEYWEQELKDQRPDGIGSLTFTINLYQLTNGQIVYNMEYSELMFIKHTLINSHKKVSPEKTLTFENDTRYHLKTIAEGNSQTDFRYITYKSEIQNHGCFVVKTTNDTVKVYTPQLAIVLTSKNLPVENLDKNRDTTIIGLDYLDSYVEGYKDGVRYFENEFAVSPNIIYGNAENYVRDIHSNFFHVKHFGQMEGWSFVKKRYPTVICHEVIKEYGYYSGIVNKVEEQAKKYPHVFSTFDKCDHQIQSEDIEPPKLDEIKPIFNFASQSQEKESLINPDLNNSQTRSEKLKVLLSSYNFYNFLKTEKALNQIQINKIQDLIIQNEVPFIIALLSEIGFLDYFKKEFCNGKAKVRDKKLAEILEVNSRRIRGNINILNPKSAEEKSTYTSHLYKENIKNLIKGL